LNIPQQKSQSNDCGIYLLHYLEQIIMTLDELNTGKSLANKMEEIASRHVTNIVNKRIDMYNRAMELRSNTLDNQEQSNVNKKIKSTTTSIMILDTPQTPPDEREQEKEHTISANTMSLTIDNEEEAALVNNVLEQETIEMDSPNDHKTLAVDASVDSDDDNVEEEEEEEEQQQVATRKRKPSRKNKTVAANKSSKRTSRNRTKSSSREKKRKAQATELEESNTKRRKTTRQSSTSTASSSEEESETSDSVVPETPQDSDLEMDYKKEEEKKVLPVKSTKVKNTKRKNYAAALNSFKNANDPKFENFIVSIENTIKAQSRPATSIEFLVYFLHADRIDFIDSISIQLNANPNSATFLTNVRNIRVAAKYLRDLLPYYFYLRYQALLDQHVTSDDPGERQYESVIAKMLNEYNNPQDGQVVKPITKEKLLISVPLGRLIHELRKFYLSLVDVKDSNKKRRLYLVFGGYRAKHLRNNFAQTAYSLEASSKRSTPYQRFVELCLEHKKEYLRTVVREKLAKLNVL
jgi:chemotaxis protein histidine kinase CheA